MNDREAVVQGMEEQKLNLQRKREAVMKKEKELDRAIQAISEIPMMDSVMQTVLSRAVVDVQVSGACTGTTQIPAMEYLEWVQDLNRKRAGLNPFPKYPVFPTDNPQAQNGMDCVDGRSD